MDHFRRGKPIDPERARRLPPGQALTEKWPVLHYGQVPKIDLGTWRFRIEGLVRPERELTWEEFRALPTVTTRSDFHCVTRWSRLDNEWEGVATRDVLAQVEVLAEARFVMIYGENDFSANVSLDEFVHDGCLFAWSHDGEPLTPMHGGPLRLIVPKLYAWKSAKWVTGIELLARDRPGFWERNGYHMHGDPWTEERFGG